MFSIFSVLENRNRWLIFGSLNHFMKFLKCQNDQIGTLEKIKETMTVKSFQNISNVPFILKLIFNVPECSLFMFAQWAVFSPKRFKNYFKVSFKTEIMIDSTPETWFQIIQDHLSCFQRVDRDESRSKNI